MKIEILVFKYTGKFYANCVAVCDRDIPLFKDEFKRFIADNLPARCKDGYIVVRDVEDSQSFHFCLYREDEITRFIET